MSAVALPTKIKLDVVTPDRHLLSEVVDEVTLPGSEGYLGILPGHLPLLTTLGIGVMSYHKGTAKFIFSVSGGFVEVLPDRVIVMADTLERPEEIDVARAQASKDRAEKELHSRAQINVDQAMAHLLRAVTRLHVAEMRR
jgi:F-type H+-transporting ATPase subunit epsilon